MGDKIKKAGNDASLTAVGAGVGALVSGTSHPAVAGGVLAAGVAGYVGSNYGSEIAEGTRRVSGTIARSVERVSGSVKRGVQNLSGVVRRNPPNDPPSTPGGIV